MSSLDYWRNEWKKVTETDELFDVVGFIKKYTGGEVTNETDLRWLVSGSTNSADEDFALLPPQTNSDDWPWTKQQLKGDLDAVWPAGMNLKNGVTGEIVKYGAFKVGEFDNANIVIENGESVIYDFNAYFPEDRLPSGWKLPEIWDPRKK